MKAFVRVADFRASSVAVYDRKECSAELEMIRQLVVVQSWAYHSPGIGGQLAIWALPDERRARRGQS
jgi:hypothetical protein